MTEKQFIAAAERQRKTLPGNMFHVYVQLLPQNTPRAGSTQVFRTPLGIPQRGFSLVFVQDFSDKTLFILLVFLQKRGCRNYSDKIWDCCRDVVEIREDLYCGHDWKQFNYSK